MSGQFALLKHIYTYCPPFDEDRHVFFGVQHLEKASYRDEVLQLDVYYQVEDQIHQIVPLTFIDSAKFYFVSLNRAKNDPSIQ